MRRAAIARTVGLWLFMLWPIVVLTAVMAVARPAELPPAGFTGRQYIDSTGCVFQRGGTGGGWQARLDLDGQPICGYPPTPVADRGGIGTGPPDHDPPVHDPPEMPGMSVAESRLLAAVAGEMRPGEFAARSGAAGPSPPDAGAAAAADPDAVASPASGRAPVAGDAMDRPATRADLTAGDAPAAAADLARASDTGPGHARPAPAAAEDADKAIGQQIAAAVALSTDMTAAAAGSSDADSRLCALIGAAPRPGGAVTLGGDTALGHCGAATIARAAKAGQTPAGATLRPAAVGRTGRGDEGRAQEGRAHEGARADRKKAVRRAASAGPDRAASKPGTGTVVVVLPVIPPGARWLEVGRFADPAQADQAAARLAAAGVPVGRSTSRGARPVTAVLAGPFGSRQSIVKTRDRLIRAGWRNLVPR